MRGGETVNSYEFLSWLYSRMPNSAYINMRFIGNNGGKPPNHFFRVGEFRGYSAKAFNKRVETMNANYNVYHRVACSHEPRDSKLDETLHWCVPAVWCDIDEVRPTLFKELKALQFVPSLVLFSGGGYHLYWKLLTPYCTHKSPSSILERVNDGIARVLNGDMACKNINRILRTADTYNIKPKYDPAPLTKVLWDSGRVYPFALLKNAFARHAEATLPDVRVTFPDGYKPRYDDEYPTKRVKDFMSMGAPLHQRNKTLFGCASDYRDAGRSQMEAEQVLVSRAVSIGLSQREAITAINSAYRYTPQIQLPRHLSLSKQVSEMRKRHAK